MTTPLRRDAAQNRERLLAAARELLAEEGGGVTLHAVARRAGVGVGTAYRRFEDKDALIQALFDEMLAELESFARAALEQESAWDGIVGFLEQSMDLQFGDRGLTVVMNHRSLAAERAARARDRVAPLLAELVARAKAEGSVRPDLEQTDIIFLQAGLAAVLDRSRTVAPQLYRRYLAIFLDGIRADRSLSPLPVEALDATTTHAAMTRDRQDG